MSSLLPRLLRLRVPARGACAVGGGLLSRCLLGLGLLGLGLAPAAADPLPPPVVRASDGLPAPARRTARPTRRRTPVIGRSVILIRRSQAVASKPKPVVKRPQAVASKPKPVKSTSARPSVRAAKPTPIRVRKRIVVPPPSKLIARLAKTPRRASARSSVSRSSASRAPTSKIKLTPPPRVRRVKHDGKKRKQAVVRTPRVLATPKAAADKRKVDPKPGNVDPKPDEKRVVLIPRGACEGDT